MGHPNAVICFAEVKIMTAKNKLICLRNLETYFCEEANNTKTAERVVEAEQAKKSRIISLVAEETEEGHFILIEKFQYFAALKKVKRSDLRLPCLVYPSTSEKERLLHILKVSIPLDKDMPWLFFHKHVRALLDDHKMSLHEIAKHVNCNMTKIKTYVLDSRIPVHIQEKAVEMKARTIIQSICSNRVIPARMKAILYEKAILNKDHVHRLTSEKLKHMITLCEYYTAPLSLLHDQFKLEQFINELLLNNFYLDQHFESLASSPVNQPANSKWSIFSMKYRLSPRRKARIDSPIKSD